MLRPQCSVLLTSALLTVAEVCAWMQEPSCPAGKGAAQPVALLQAAALPKASHSQNLVAVQRSPIAYPSNQTHGQSHVGPKPATTVNESYLQPAGLGGNISLTQSDAMQRVLVKPMPVMMTGCDSEVNPAGEKAPLTQEGYFAVKTRCCQLEMMRFIRRVVESFNMEVCNDGGVVGMAKYHTCGSDRQLADLESDIQRDEKMRCTWLAMKGACQPRPPDCPDFSGLPPPIDCMCSKANHTPLTFTRISVNNLGGEGPSGGHDELRLPDVGVSDDGKRIDLVIISTTRYYRGIHDNKIRGDFVEIATSAGATMNLRFYFMESGTYKLVTLKETLVSFFDVDGVPDWYENLYVTGYTGYVTDLDTHLSVDRAADGRTKYTADTENADNPSDKDGLTISQRKASVMFFFKQKSNFQVSFTVAPETSARNPQRQRALMFAGASQLVDRCGP